MKVEDTLLKYRSELEAEITRIAEYWKKFTINPDGGFYGSVTNDNKPVPHADGGIVMYSRILWAFSKMYAHTNNDEHLRIAERSFVYILEHFVDLEFDGVYWSVDASGNVKDDKKQIYGLAFCIYGMSAYFMVSKNETALMLAVNLFNIIEEQSFDSVNRGYVEAFTRTWEEIADLRLSEKDDNERKTMNTHLHLVEAYTSLYQVWPDEKLKQQIIGLLEIFQQHMIDPENYHLHLFMDDHWTTRSSLISYGHDIEASWLLLDCARAINDTAWTTTYSQLAGSICCAALEGLDKDGGLWYEYDPATEVIIKEKHSWVQAEAMLGLINTYEITGEEKYLFQSINNWQFVKNHILDQQHGEWFWGISDNGQLMNKEKIGFWKCPYHNTRACLEIIQRIDHLIKSQS